MSDINAVANAFITHYYGLFDSGKQGASQLVGLYQASSMLSFEGKNIVGAEAIVQHLTVSILIHFAFTPSLHTLKRSKSYTR